MTEEDKKLLASMGMTEAEVDAIAAACEAGDTSMWDGSEVSHESPLGRFLEAKEDQEDIEVYKKALAEFEADPRTYTLDEVEEMIGLKEDQQDVRHHLQS